jgi:arylsulfatase A-like enzyme
MPEIEAHAKACLWRYLMRQRVLIFSIWLAGVVAAFDSTCRAADRPLNVVLIVSDDLGYMDIAANNPRTFYKTPNIDRLARDGMRFTQGYANCPVCSPTRASIMTGKYPQRTGITDFIGGRRQGKLKPAPNQGQLALEEVTIAERLRDAGYATFFAGKWHLGGPRFGPNEQGFSNDLTGSGQFYYPRNSSTPPDAKADLKQTDRIADAAAAFIEAHKDKPFFAYLPFLAVHIPVEARQDLVEAFEKKKQNAPDDAWGKERANRVRLVQNHAKYAAMLAQMDEAIGRVMAALERSGVEENTVVIFTSDNGGLSTAEGHPTSNLPLRAGKGWLYEGGIRTPWIIRAPGVATPASVCETPVITADLYPTILELAGLPLMPEQHRDGASLLPLLKGGELDRGAPLFWHYPHYSNQGSPPSGAIRDGDWKLIEWYEDGSRELFQLRDDLGESKNVAEANPEKVAELHAKLVAWRGEVKAAMPTPNPEFDQKAPQKQNKQAAAK